MQPLNHVEFERVTNARERAIDSFTRRNPDSFLPPDLRIPQHVWNKTEKRQYDFMNHFGRSCYHVCRWAGWGHDESFAYAYSKFGGR